MSIKLLGIDVGTGGTRALLIDESGAVIASAIHEHQPFASPRSGWAEQDPHDWWKACQGAVTQAAQGFVDRQPRRSHVSASAAKCTARCCWTATTRSCGLRSSGAISARRLSAAISTTPLARNAWLS